MIQKICFFNSRLAD